MKKEIMIQIGVKRKIYRVNPLRYNEIRKTLEYYGYLFILKDMIYVYENKRRFNLVDLYLSGFATPEPPAYMLK